MEKTQVAWAAGLFEGEGTWIVRKRGHPHAALGMRDRDVVERFAAIVGFGNIARVDRRKRNPNHSDMWYWQLSNAMQVCQLIDMFWPYLGDRRRAKAVEIREAATKIGLAGRSKYATHCHRGHEFTEENTYRQPTPASPKGWTRRCRACQAEHERKRRAAKST